MENIKDWCISRQIWWGHQIPAWYCKQCNAGKLGDGEYNRALPQKPLTGHPGETEIPQSQKETWPWISADAKPIVATAQPTHCKDCGGNAFIQDPDVLDTWFSSALWPFSTLGWPDEHSEFYKKFYPTSTLVTSFDILFFWVARMIMMGLHFTKQVPFKDVYIHALVRDAEGQKMSKSKGNVIDPLSIMDQYGTDALRFTLAAMASPGRDVKLSEQRIEGYRNFANKLWNAARFVLMNTEGHAIQHDPTQRSLADRWITIRLHRHINTVWQDLEAYRFDETANHLYQFVWHEFCDWYIELAKPRLAPDTPPEDAAATRATMVSTLETTLRLLHPLMPFITEEIWQKVPHHGDTIVRAVFPQPEPVSIEDQVVEGIMTDVIAVITAIRTTRSELNVAPVQLLRAGLKTSAATAKRLLDYGEQDICRLARLSQFHVGPEVSAPSSAVVNATAVGELFVVLEGLDREKERARIQKTLDAAHVELVRLDAKLKNPQFVTKAPADVVADHERRQSELRQQTLLLAEQIRRFGSGTSTP
jgi:valyl-tRNA synthetase